MLCPEPERVQRARSADYCRKDNKKDLLGVRCSCCRSIRLCPVGMVMLSDPVCVWLRVLPPASKSVGPDSRSGRRQKRCRWPSPQHGPGWPGRLRSFRKKHILGLDSLSASCFKLLYVGLGVKFNTIYCGCQAVDTYIPLFLRVENALPEIDLFTAVDKNRKSPGRVSRALVQVIIHKILHA